MNKRNLFLLVIILFATFLRVWKLNEIPPHLTPDEASLGYNAYSIWQTGRDEHGEVLPIIFKSFGDYKPGFYVYLTVPFVAIFGLTEFAVRLPSALAGVIAVWLLYKTVNILFQNEKFEVWNLKSIGAVGVGIWPAFLLAVSPWHIFFSRGAWEANVSLSFTLAGIYFSLKALKNGGYLILSSFSLSLTLLTYQGAKLSTLIVILILGILYFRDFLGINRKIIIASSVIFTIIALPILLSFFIGKTSRLTIFSVFSYPRPQEYLQNFLDQGNEKVGNIGYYLFHSETLNFARGVAGRWFNHFSGRFLFFEGDYQNPLHSAPNHGMLLLVDLLFLLSGIVAIARVGIDRKTMFVLLWLLLAPLPAAFSRDQVQAVRALNMVIPLTLVSSVGVVFLIQKIKSLSVMVFRVTGFVLLAFLFFGSLVYYFDSYFVHLPKHNSEFWSYGYKQIVETVLPIKDEYESVKIQQSFAQPYIYFLFYSKYDPVEYQKQAKLVESEYKGDVGYVEKLDNIRFVPIDWVRDSKLGSSLVVGDPIQVPVEISGNDDIYSLIDEVRYLNGEVVFRVVEVK